MLQAASNPWSVTVRSDGSQFPWKLGWGQFDWRSTVVCLPKGCEENSPASVELQRKLEFKGRSFQPLFQASVNPGKFAAGFTRSGVKGEPLAIPGKHG